MLKGQGMGGHCLTLNSLHEMQHTKKSCDMPQKHTLPHYDGKKIVSVLLFFHLLCTHIQKSSLREVLTELDTGGRLLFLDTNCHIYIKGWPHFKKVALYSIISEFHCHIYLSTHLSTHLSSIYLCIYLSI